MASSTPQFPADRWIAAEHEALAEFRSRCASELKEQIPFPELVGDRRLLRFIRGRGGNVTEATEQYLGHLKWRKENNVDQIRQDIVYGGMNEPKKFPNGEKLLRLAPQIIIAPVRDRKNQPICTEQYNFSPKKLFQESSLEEYLLFLIYALEFRNLVLEHMSHQMDVKYLEEHPRPQERSEGWGMVIRNCTIRDLGGLKWEHVGADGRAFVKAAISVGSPNYPEVLGKSHMINTPWLFNTLWVFLKQMLDTSTIDKINILGSDYMTELSKEVPLTSIPKEFGGTYDKNNESYTFDYSKTGPIWYEGCPPAPSSDQPYAPTVSEKVIKFIGDAMGTSTKEGRPAAAVAGAEEPETEVERDSTASSSQSARLSLGRSSIPRPSFDARPSELEALLARTRDEDDPFYSPRRMSRSLSAVGKKVLVSSEALVRNEIVDPFYYLTRSSPLLALLALAYVTHVLMRLDLSFLRYFIIPGIICAIDMAIGLRF